MRGAALVRCALVFAAPGQNAATLDDSHGVGTGMETHRYREIERVCDCGAEEIFAVS